MMSTDTDRRPDSYPFVFDWKALSPTAQTVVHVHDLGNQIAERADRFKKRAQEIIANFDHGDIASAKNALDNMERLLDGMLAAPIYGGRPRSR